jgi:hypothetical protein
MQFKGHKQNTLSQIQDTTLNRTTTTTTTIIIIIIIIEYIQPEKLRQIGRI